MEQQDFTIQDIKDFMLNVCKLKWYGEIYDYELNCYRQATIDDFKTFKRSELFVVEMRSEGQNEYYDSTAACSLPVIIFKDDFKIPRGRDYSKKWQEFKAHRKTETLNI